MLRIAMRSVVANKLRLGLTALAVVLGVSFVSGTFVLTDSIDEAFGGLLADVNEGVDAYVNPPAEAGLNAGGPPGVDTSAGATLDEDLLDDVLAVDGVADAVGSVEGVAQVAGPDGDLIGGQGPPQLGFSANEGSSAITIRDGRVPDAPGEVAIDVTTVQAGGFELGDDVTVVTSVGVEQFELVGTVGFGEEDNLLGATLSVFELGEAQRLFDREGRLDQIVVTADDGTSADQLVADLDAAIGGDVEIISALDQQQQDQQEITEGLAFLDTILLSFAGVSLFVGAFLIVNTFSITVAQRMREFALLRAVGASARQVRSIVVLEALALGLIGGALGIGGGIGVSQFLQVVFGAIGADFPSGGLVIAPRTVVASFALSIGVTLVAALLPARRAARVSPVEALRGTGEAGDRVGRVRTVVGLVLTLGGAALIAAGLTLDTGQSLPLVGGGVAGMFWGVALVAPWIAKPVTTAIGQLLGPSVTGRLARANAARNPSRTASTASALTIGVALVTFVSIVAASVTASIGVLFEEQFRADLNVTSQGGFGTLPLALSEDLRELDGVESVADVRATIAERDGDAGSGGAFGAAGQLLVVGADPAVIDDHLALGLAPGAVAAAADLGDRALLVSDDVAESQELAVGDAVVLDLATASGVEFEVAGTFGSSDLLGSGWLIPLAAWDEVVGSTAATNVSIVFDDGADRVAARAAVEEVTAGYPGVGVQDVGEALADVEAQVDGLLNVLIGLLALALVIAVIGIVNTLALSVLERTREIGLLRAVGMLRRQVRATVRAEAVLVSLFGALLGIGLGVGFGWALVTALADEGIGALVLPGTRLAAYLVGAAVAGVLAAVLPARRAARLDVLAAVTTE